MDITGAALFDLADQRLAWLDRRQAVLSRNIANADTPQFRPSDIAPFAQALQNAQFTVTPLRTDPADLPGFADAQAHADALYGETAPDGNAVSLDDQLRRVADTDTQHELVTDLYSRYLAMFRAAIGR